MQYFNPPQPQFIPQPIAVPKPLAWGPALARYSRRPETWRIAGPAWILTLIGLAFSIGFFVAAFHKPVIGPEPQLRVAGVPAQAMMRQVRAHFSQGSSGGSSDTTYTIDLRYRDQAGVAQDATVKISGSDAHGLLHIAKDELIEDHPDQPFAIRYDPSDPTIVRTQQQLDRWTRPAPVPFWVPSAIALATVLVTVFLVLLPACRTVALLEGGQRTEGTITWSRWIGRGLIQLEYAFTLPGGGTLKRHTGAVGAGRARKLIAGRTLPVFYDPGNPKRSIADTWYLRWKQA